MGHNSGYWWRLWEQGNAPLGGLWIVGLRLLLSAIMLIPFMVELAPASAIQGCSILLIGVMALGLGRWLAAAVVAVGRTRIRGAAG